MKMHLTRLPDIKLFTGHEPGCIIVNGERFNKSVVVQSQQVFEDWDIANFAALTEQHFTYFLEMKPDVVLVGTGKQQKFAHPKLYYKLTEAGIGVEFMDTAAACRTYNILVAEDRNAIAAILF